MNMKKIIGLFLLLVILSACAAPAASQPTAVGDQGYPPPGEKENTPEAYPGWDVTPTETVLTQAPTQDIGTGALPAEPQVIEFQASDGQVLKGTYYPSADNPAPVVVLMHWSGGDQSDWAEVAFWLQNRGLSGRMGTTAPAWWDPSWFPALLEGESYAVFTFTFRGCEGGCESFDRELWLLDAQAAMDQARKLPGVYSEWIIAVGASIGADGAADGCLWLNQNGGGCHGALSLSPGSYLTLPYPQVVTDLGALTPAVPAQCLYAVNDPESAVVCKAAQGDNYTAVEYPGNAHGMVLLSPDVVPSAMQLILDFVRATISG
jgi:hypothetical protein